MLFNSAEFLVFCLVVYAAYYLSPLKFQNILLLAASYFFYGFWDYRFLSLVLISTLVDYIAGLSIHAAKKMGRPRHARRWLVLSILANLGMLGFFKYFDFFAGSLARIAVTFGVSLSPFTLDVILPVGISFYTFQSLGYTVDVYRGKVKPTRNLLDFALFVAFFPQLMAGPIERAKRLLPQIQHRRVVSNEFIKLGSWLIFWGLFKKVFIADNLAPYTYWGTVGGGAQTGLDGYLVSVAFAIRFYCDFSGYSDMARGLAALMGIKISRNFNLPFFSSNPSEFWTRWHITLGTWFRDYVYAPLRSWKGGRLPRGLAAILTMSLVGLWHGANWNFVLWGALWGCAMVGHRLTQPATHWITLRYPVFAPLITFLGVLTTIHIFILIGPFFVANDAAHGFQMISLMVGDFGQYSRRTFKDMLTVLFFSWPLLAMQFAQYYSRDPYVIGRLPLIARAAIYLIMTVLLIANGAETKTEFIYFQF